MVARLSIVVPVYRVRDYLPECLDSLLDQPFRDIEVIAVDDASPDDCGTLLDDYAARDPRVTVVHKDTNEGIGAARNTGAALAGGDYLVFLDADDSCAEGALGAIADRVGELGEPEILLVDHVRRDPSGRTRGSGGAELLRAAGDELFAPADRPEYLAHFTQVCNRVFRRDFYQEHGFTFPDGIYEDDAVALQTMLSAARLGCLPQAAFTYRLRASGNLMRLRGRAHFALLRQYEAVFRFLDARPELDRVRAAVFAQWAEAALFLLRRPDRVEPALREEFFRSAHEMYRLRRPPSFDPPAGRRGGPHRALASGNWTAFRAVEAGTVLIGRLASLRRRGGGPARADAA